MTHLTLLEMPQPTWWVICSEYARCLAAGCMMSSTAIFDSSCLMKLGPRPSAGVWLCRWQTQSVRRHCGCPRQRSCRSVPGRKKAVPPSAVATAAGGPRMARPLRMRRQSRRRQRRRVLIFSLTLPRGSCMHPAFIQGVLHHPLTCSSMLHPQLTQHEPRQVSLS